MRGPDGSVQQAGIGLKPVKAHGAGLALPTRGVVLSVFYADDEQASRGRVTREVLCSVLTYAGGFLPRVPVLQQGSAVTNGSLWVPQASTVNLDTGDPLTFTNAGLPVRPFPSLDALNGDRVLVTFLEGDPKQPVITGTLGHPRSKRAPGGTQPGPLPSPDADGSQSPAPDGRERWVGHQGSVARIDRVGNVRLDTTNAGTADDGTTLEAGDAGAGHVDVDLSELAEVVIRFQGEVAFRLRVEPGEGPHRVLLDIGADADERLVLGDRFMALFDNHRHVTFYGQTGTVTPESTMATAQAAPERAALADSIKMKG